MKALVVYSSQSGNTKKLAQAASEALEGQVDLAETGAKPSADGYDLVVCGFWLKAGSPDPATAEFLPGLSGQKLFLFATHGAAAGSDHAKAAMAKAQEMAQGAQLVGSFSCQGAVNPGLLEKVKAQEKRPVWIDDADGAVGHPDQGDVDAFKAALTASL